MVVPKKSELVKTHNAPRHRQANEMEWETLRFPGQFSKMLFHPSEQEPTRPNAGLVRYEAGANHPVHSHQFAQVWYILEGEFKIGDATHGPGTMFFYGDPHYEDQLSTETGGTMFFVQYQGPTTGGRPVCDGQFNLAERPDLEAENLAT